MGEGVAVWLGVGGGERLPGAGGNVAVVAVEVRAVSRTVSGDQIWG